MNFIEFTKITDKDKIIDIRNIVNYFNGIDRRRLYEWQKKGYLVKIVNNFYCMPDVNAEDNFLKSVASKIYCPSYVGLESALAYYNLIPDTIFQTISITTRRNKLIKTRLGDFNYRSLKNSLFFGYRLVETNRGPFFISDPEKTLLDFFHFSAGSEKRNFLKEMRFNLNEIQEVINVEKTKDYLQLFSSVKIDKATKRLMDIADVKF